MDRTARLNRERLNRFNRCWEDLFAVMPTARTDAVQAMGEEVKRILGAEIQSSALASGAKGTVISWQALRLGSKGGYAAIKPDKGTAPPKGGEKQHTWKGKPVTKKQVTRWLDRGHGVRKPAPGSAAAWARPGHLRAGSGRTYVQGRQFYSRAKAKALDCALRAADKVLSQIADEVDY